MKRHLPLYLAFACTLAFGLFLALPEPAEAGCDALCVRVSPGCRECVHTGSYTGANCIQHLPCYCIYTECTSAAHVSAEATTGPDGVPELLREQPALTEEATQEASTCQLMSLLSLPDLVPAAE